MHITISRSLLGTTVNGLAVCLAHVRAFFPALHLVVLCPWKPAILQLVQVKLIKAALIGSGVAIRNHHCNQYRLWLLSAVTVDIRAKLDVPNYPLETVRNPPSKNTSVQAPYVSHNIKWNWCQTAINIEKHPSVYPRGVLVCVRVYVYLWFLVTHEQSLTDVIWTRSS